MPSRHHRFICLSALLFLSFLRVHAQEVDCTIQVNYEAVATSHKDLLIDFASDIRDYVNNYKWGPDNLDEKVRCTMTIFIQNVVGENRYSAQVFIGSQRPIYGTEKSTAVVRLFDDAWDFTYVRSRPINHNLYSFNDLTSFLDFYVYIILGFDYDSYEALSGTAHFQKAADVANLGRSTGARGWQAKPGSYSRTQLIDEILNPKFTPVRSASSRYHFAGLDSLTINSSRAYGNILQAVESIGRAKREADPRNILIRAFFDTKYMELAETFMHYPDPGVYARLIAVDPSHQVTYEEYRSKRR